MCKLERWPIMPRGEAELLAQYLDEATPMTEKPGPSEKVAVRSSRSARFGVLGGHPPGIAVLAVTEVWERMSYYGMRALLVFYMTKYLVLSQPHASMIYGAYTAAVWFAPLPGGLISDRFLGQRRSVLLGGTLMALGHFFMAFKSLFYLALVAIAVGNGLFKPSISTQVGDLYGPEDSRRDRGYSIYYVAVSLGSFIAPLVCGTVGELYGWHWGFGLAGAGMVLGLLTYYLGRRWLPPDRLFVKPAAKPASATQRMDRAKILALVAISLSATFFWMIYEQQGNTIALWADSAIDRRVTLGSLQGVIPATWFQSLNGLFILALTPPLIAYWAHQSSKGREPSSTTKTVIGAAIATATYLALALLSLISGDHTPISWIWLTAYFLLMTLAELYLSPTCLSLFNKAAPKHLASTFVGVWYLSLFLGSYLAGYAGSFWSRTPTPVYFLAMAGFGLLSAAALMLTRRVLSGALETEATPPTEPQRDGLLPSRPAS